MIVVVQLGGHRALAQVVRRGDQDRLDLRVPMIYEDGHADVLEIFGARRGLEDGQWQELELSPLPEVESVASASEPEAVEVKPVEPPAPPRLPALVSR